MTSVGLKMRLEGFHPAGCTAEEIAYHVMKGRAAEILEGGGKQADFGPLDDETLEDTDHEHLWVGALDGIEQSAFGQWFGSANLRCEDWFVPFNPPRSVHPYADDGDTPPWVGDRDLYEDDTEASDTAED